MTPNTTLVSSKPALSQAHSWSYPIQLAMKAIALLTLLCLSGVAEARIGETLDQCSYR
jgi:hypothetical protein